MDKTFNYKNKGIYLKEDFCFILDLSLGFW